MLLYHTSKFFRYITSIDYNNRLVYSSDVNGCSNLVVFIDHDVIYDGGQDIMTHSRNMTGEGGSESCEIGGVIYLKGYISYISNIKTLNFVVENGNNSVLNFLGLVT